jgi:hypothetical protein
MRSETKLLAVAVAWPLAVAWALELRSLLALAVVVAWAVAWPLALALALALALRSLLAEALAERNPLTKFRLSLKLTGLTILDKLGNDAAAGDVLEEYALRASSSRIRATVWRIRQFAGSFLILRLTNLWKNLAARRHMP